MKAIEVGSVAWTLRDFSAWVTATEEDYQVLVTVTMFLGTHPTAGHGFNLMMRAIPLLDGQPVSGFSFDETLFITQPTGPTPGLLATTLFKLRRQIEESFDELYLPAGS